VAQQGSPPGRLPSRRAARPLRPERPGWQARGFGPDDTDSDLPPWAPPSGYRDRPAATHGTAPAVDPFVGGYAGEDQRSTDDGSASGHGAGAKRDDGRSAERRRGRAAATRLRKSRRRVYRWSGVAIGACVVAALIVAMVTRHSPKPSLYVTALQSGEFKSVPSACSSVSTAVLGQYLPGAGRTTTNQFASPTQSQCSFTIDAKPVFRLLEVSAQAYQPFAAASGNGSASANAKDNLVLDRAALASPPKKSPLSPAQIIVLPKLGQQAFAAAQHEDASGIISDVVTVVVLERNVLITVELSAQESGGFSQTSVGTLQAGAMAAAQNLLAKVQAQATA
jgi:hypothetical protein